MTRKHRRLLLRLRLIAAVLLCAGVFSPLLLAVR